MTRTRADALVPAATAVAFSGAAAHAYRLRPLSQYGEAYEHVTAHLVSCGMAVLVAVAVATVADRATTARARRAGRALAVTWVLVAAAFGAEAYGAKAAHGFGESSVHSAAAMLLLAAALLLLLASLMVTFTRGGAVPWPLRLGLVVSLPGCIGVTQAQSVGSLSLSFAAGAVWAAVALHAVRQRSGGDVAAAVPAPG